MFCKRKWNTTGSIIVDTYNDYDHWTNIEIIIHFTSVGEYDPGRTYGDPYYCYPPELTDERELDYVEMILDGPQGKTTIKLDKEAGQQLFDRYETEIYAADLDDDRDDGPDPDRYRD